MEDNSLEQEKKSKNKPKLKILKQIILVLFLLGIICCDIIVYLLYGPWHGFRDWLITTAMTTFTHQYLATWFYSNEQIEECLNRNRIEALTGYTDESLINIINYNQIKVSSYKNEYERQILEKDPNNNDYKIIEIDGKKYHGYMAVIYDPSRIQVCVANNLGSSNGEMIETISKRNNAILAINGGGYTVPKPSIMELLGITISNNNLLSSNHNNIIGFNKNNKLILGNFSSEQALNNNIRDCVSFVPYLILNGKKAEIYGNAGYGTASRTAIGQRADGIVLFLVLDGDRKKLEGATMQDLIDIFEKYGAINAANLDGGTSSSLVCKNKTINDVRHGGHPIPTAFILKADDSDDGDYSVVKDKVDNE